jgi:hypothetical protein
LQKAVRNMQEKKIIGIIKLKEIEEYVKTHTDDEIEKKYGNY